MISNFVSKNARLIHVEVKKAYSSDVIFVIPPFVRTVPAKSYTTCITHPESWQSCLWIGGHETVFVRMVTLDLSALRLMEGEKERTVHS